MENNNPQKIRATVVVLNYTKAARVAEGIGYILKQEVDFGFKFIVIDNSANAKETDILKEKARQYPSVELIINKKNLGYAKGRNLVKGKEEGEYLVAVNPDILFKDRNALSKMVKYMDAHPDIAILGPKQINDDGSLAMSVRAFPKLYLQVARRTFLRHLPLFKNKIAYDEMRHLDYSKIQDVDWLQDSCIIIRRDFWEKVGGYNEHYFLFMADIELCVRAWESGYRVVYYPETQVWADGKRLSAGGLLTFFKSWVLRQHVSDALKYTLRHLTQKDPRQSYYEKHKS